MYNKTTLRRKEPYNVYIRKLLSGNQKIRKVYQYTINPESGVPAHLCERRKSTGCSTRADAHQFVLERIDHLKKGDPKVDLLLREYIKPFFLTDRCPHVKRLKDDGKSITEAYIRSTRSLVERRILPHAIVNMKLGEITRGDVLDFRADLRKLLSGRMVNRTMAALKIVFNEAVYKELPH